MKASEIRVQDCVKIELPNTDALQIVSSQTCMNNWVKEHGDLWVELSGDGVYTVPSFREGRQKFFDSKTAFCRQWGCE